MIDDIFSLLEVLFLLMGKNVFPIPVQQYSILYDSIAPVCFTFSLSIGKFILLLMTLFFVGLIQQ